LLFFSKNKSAKNTNQTFSRVISQLWLHLIYSY